MEFLGSLHPPVVHFAIGLVITSVIFDLLGLILKNNNLKYAGLYTLVGGAIATILAFLTGHQAEGLVEDIIKGSEVYKRLELHETIGLVVLVSVILLTIFRVFITKKEDLRLLGIYILVGLIVSSIVVLQGRIGGKLVYEFGLGVKPVMENMKNDTANQ